MAAKISAFFLSSDEGKYFLDITYTIPKIAPYVNPKNAPAAKVPSFCHTLYSPSFIKINYFTRCNTVIHFNSYSLIDEWLCNKVINTCQNYSSYNTR